MSFSSRVKDELSRQASAARHCRIAEMSAILSLCGRVKISASDHFSIEMHTENVAVARKYFTLLKKTFNISTDVSIRRGGNVSRNRTYIVAVREHDDALKVLQAAKLIDAQGEIRRICRWYAMWWFRMPVAEGLLSEGRFSLRVQSVTRRNSTILRLSALPWQRLSSLKAS